jgi:hypothetical protein
MNILWNRIASHWQAVLTAAGILYAAFVTSMPEHPPQKFEDYWAWVRSALQSSLPIHRPQNTQGKENA